MRQIGRCQCVHGALGIITALLGTSLNRKRLSYNRIMQKCHDSNAAKSGENPVLTAFFNVHTGRYSQKVNYAAVPFQAGAYSATRSVLDPAHCPLSLARTSPASISNHDCPGFAFPRRRALAVYTETARTPRMLLRQHTYMLRALSANTERQGKARIVPYGAHRGIGTARSPSSRPEAGGPGRYAQGKNN